MTFDQIFFTVLIRMGQIYNTDRSVLQELEKLCRMSDCEELVGGYSQEMLKLQLKISFIIHPVLYLIVSYSLPSFPISDIY